MSHSQGNDEPEFKVRDRRRFDAEGHERPDVDDEAPAEATSSGGTGDLGPDRASPGQSAGHAFPPIDFSTFILSLSTSVMVHLGEAPAPDGQTDKNLEMARQVIDIIALLQEKTRGNVTPDEQQLLEQLLYDLRLRYVKAAQ